MADVTGTVVVAGFEIDIEDDALLNPDPYPDTDEEPRITLREQVTFVLLTLRNEKVVRLSENGTSQEILNALRGVASHGYFEVWADGDEILLVLDGAVPTTNIPY